MARTKRESGRNLFAQREIQLQLYEENCRGAGILRRIRSVVELPSSQTTAAAILSRDRCRFWPAMGIQLRRGHWYDIVNRSSDRQVHHWAKVRVAAREKSEIKIRRQK